MAARPGGVARRAIAERFALNGKRGYRIQAHRPGSPHFPTFEGTDSPKHAADTPRRRLSAKSNPYSAFSVISACSCGGLHYLPRGGATDRASFAAAVGNLTFEDS
jgi:hypothetical protein